jgi:thioredoxin-like negative regulator of GroEL
MKTLEIKTKNKSKVDKLLKSSKPAIILFHMNGCGHCVEFHPVWTLVVKELDKTQDIELAEVEYNSMGLLPENIRTSIAGFPTIQVLRQGKAIEEYMGDRTKENLREFINKYITTPPPSAPPAPATKKPKPTPKSSATSKATNTKKKTKTNK